MKTDLYIAILFFILASASFGLLNSANDTYIKTLQAKANTMNMTIDMAIQWQNIYNVINDYVNSWKRYKVYIYPDYKTFEEKIIKNSYAQQYDAYFIFITSNVSGEEDYTQKFKDYTSSDKDFIYTKLNFKDLSSAYVFKGYKGFYQKIRLY